jgi:hypothetical protein
LMFFSFFSPTENIIISATVLCLVVWLWYQVREMCTYEGNMVFFLGADDQNRVCAF